MSEQAEKSNMSGKALKRFVDSQPILNMLSSFQFHSHIQSSINSLDADFSRIH